MTKTKKLLTLIGIIGLTTAIDLVPRKAEAHLVCDDRYRFCTANCTSFSPSNCRSKCAEDYRWCESQFQTTNPPGTGGGGD